MTRTVVFERHQIAPTSGKPRVRKPKNQQEGGFLGALLAPIAGAVLGKVASFAVNKITGNGRKKYRRRVK